MELTNLSPMQLIQKGYEVALKSGAGLEVVQSILAEMRLQRGREDLEAFNAALRRIQNKLKPIPKRGWNPQTKSPYAKIQDVDKAIEVFLKEEGMTLSFAPRPSEKDNEVVIVGIFSLGAYSKEYPLPMPADGKGPQGGGVMSRTHATGAAITYAKRYLKDMILNLSFLEKDDDGNAAGNESFMDESVEADVAAMIEGSGSEDQLKENYFAARDAAKKAGDTRAEKRFAELKNKVYRQLAKGKSNA
jgi:hypothetical protein